MGYASSQTARVALATLACVAFGLAEGITWIKGSGGANCDTVCAARGGCSDSAWPKSLGEFEVIAKEAGHTCEGTQEGGAAYDPSTDGHYCGWNGPHEDSDSDSNAARCSAAGDSSSYRFCPCASDKEL